MMDVSPNADDMTVLVRLHNLHQLIGVSFIPQDLQRIEVVVAEEDMRLRYPVLVGVISQHLIDPLNHIICYLGLLDVLIERVHAVEVENHCVIAELIDVVSARHPCSLDRGVCSDLGIGCHVCKHDFPEFLIVFLLNIACRRLVVIHYVVIADDG